MANVPVDHADLAQMRPAVLATVTGDAVAARLHDAIVGKTVLITGVSPASLGAEAARTIAQHAPKRLILASRRPALIAEVIEALRPVAGPAVALDALAVDLGDPASVRAAVAALYATHGPAFALDVLINNAAVMMLPQFETVPLAAAVPGVGTAVEKHFGTNHLGHFLLTNLLVPALRRSAAPGGARVATVMSRGYLGSPVVALDDPALLAATPANRARYDPFKAYAQSKTANLLFTAALAKRFGGRGIVALTIDPGTVGTTGVSRHVPTADQVALGWLLADGKTLNPAMPFISAAQSAGTYVTAAFDPALAAHTGATITSALVDDSILGFATDPALADRLWALSETLVGETFDWGSA